VLLNLAKQIFGHSPVAYWVRIPIENVAFGENLSPRARAGLQAALEKIQELMAGPPPPLPRLRDFPPGPLRSDADEAGKRRFDF
jgi:hypothetical protein